MSLVNADTPQLAMEAENFDRISGELTGILTHVDSVASQLQVQLNSEGAGAATQASLTRFQEAAHQQIRLLQEISGNVSESGTSYTTSDQANADDLAQAMSPHF